MGERFRRICFLSLEEDWLLMVEEGSRNNIILGGGLAGLSAAYHSGIPLYEALAKPGGTAASLDEQGFVFDLGIHVLQSKNVYFLELLDKLGVRLITHSRSGWIYSNNSYFPYPFQVNTSHLSFISRIRCIVGFLFSKGENGTSANYAEWILKNFGKGFADTFLTPYAKKFWGVSPETMTFDWTGNRVPRPNFFEVLKGAFKDQETKLGTHVVFQYPENRKQGFGAIAHAIAKNVHTIHYGMRATAIDPVSRNVFFNEGGEKASYKKLISTLPLPDLLSLLPDVPDNISQAIKSLKCNSIAVINIGVNTPSLSSKHWVHFPEPHISFFRISFPANFTDGLARPGTSTVQAEVSYLGKKPDPANLFNAVKEDLIRVGILSKDMEIVFEDIIFLPYGYVIYDHVREESVKRIHDYLRGIQIYPCGRYGTWEYLWSDQAVLSGKETVEQLSLDESSNNSSFD